VSHLDPQELNSLADRIDHEQLWRRSPFDRDQLTQDQLDRLDAGVALRRFADARFIVAKELQKGVEFIRGYKLTREDRGTDSRGCGSRDWHVAINRFSDAQRGAKGEWPRVMYHALHVADEVPRMVLLFERERTIGMAGSFKLCARDPSPATPLPDNHLRCGLGVECRKCRYLAAIDADDRMTPEAKDEAKAWTCATHFLLESRPDVYFETILRDKSDDAFDERIARSMGAEFDGDPEQPEGP
jgi:hypothetical protein